MRGGFRGRGRGRGRGTSGGSLGRGAAGARGWGRGRGRGRGRGQDGCNGRISYNTAPAPWVPLMALVLVFIRN